MPTPSQEGGRQDYAGGNATIESVFGPRAQFARRVIEIGLVRGMNAVCWASGYVDLVLENTKAQVHVVANGIVLVLRSMSEGHPETSFIEVPFESLSGYPGGGNAAWLRGTSSRYREKGPAIAYLIRDEVNACGDHEKEWREVEILLNHAKTLK